MKFLQNHIHRAHLLLAFGVIICLISGWRFVIMWTPEPLFPSPAVTETRMLSDWHPPLANTRGDTEVYIFDSGVPGGTMLICGGTHPNEPAAYITAVVILENLQVEEGRVIVIPRTNAAAFMHNDSQEAMVQFFHLETPTGPRPFRNGSRVTAPVFQWPDPTIYINPRGDGFDEIQEKYIDEFPSLRGNPGPGNQMLAGIDSRNLNRAFPGTPNGTLTEQIAYAVTTLIREENVDLALDYHEASPEYPTNNVMVAHQRAEDMVSWAELLLSDDDMPIATETSSLQLRGLSHREWGDTTDALSVLFESANVAMGRMKGRSTEEQIVTGYDGAYVRVMHIQRALNERLAARAAAAEAAGRHVTERSRRILAVDIPNEGISMDERVGRHLQATLRLLESYNDEFFDKPIAISGVPGIRDMRTSGVGMFLHGPDGSPPTGEIIPF